MILAFLVVKPCQSFNKISLVPTITSLEALEQLAPSDIGVLVVKSCLSFHMIPLVPTITSIEAFEQLAPSD